MIANPNAGDGTGPEFLQKHVVPLLESAGIACSYHQTSKASEAGALIKKHIAQSTSAVVLAGGDGTVHDALNQLFLDEITSTGVTSQRSATFTVILVPTGTANAMYHSFWLPTTGEAEAKLLPANVDPEIAPKLHSVLAYISNVKNPSSATPRPISVALAQTYPPEGSTPTHSILSCVVNSTSIHAGILHTAEKYRATIPGTERFKVAAGENIHNWGLADVELLPPPGEASVQKYDPVEKVLAPSSGSAGETQTGLEGPFFYFLSTINVNRLEPTFVTTPLALRSPPLNGAMDVVVVRPKRLEGFSEDTPQTREKFVAPAMEWFGQIYSGGEHIHHTYKEEGGGSVYMTEYFRVGGWKWTPTVRWSSIISFSEAMI